MSAPGPVGYQCPNIDRVISEVDDAVKLFSQLEDVIDNLHRMAKKTGELEIVRSACEDLREWGQEQQERADGLDKEVARLERDLETANDTIAELRRELEAALA